MITTIGAQRRTIQNQLFQPPYFPSPGSCCIADRSYGRMAFQPSHLCLPLPASPHPELPLPVGMAPGLPSDFLTNIRLGVRRGRALELRLAKWAAQRVSHAFVLDDDMGFATIDTLAANRIGNHNDLTFSSDSIAWIRAAATPVRFTSLRIRSHS